MQISEIAKALRQAFPKDHSRFARNLTHIQSARQEAGLKNTLNLQEIFELIWLAALALGKEPRLVKQGLWIQFAPDIRLQIEQDPHSESIRHCTAQTWAKLTYNGPNRRDPGAEETPELRWLAILQNAARQAAEDECIETACAFQPALPRMQKALMALGIQDQGWRFRE